MRVNKTNLNFCLVIALVLGAESSFAASFFNNRLSVQGFLKSGGSALNDAAGFPMTFVVKKNTTVVWCQSSAANIPVINGVFTTVLTGSSNCQSLLNVLDPSVFTHTANSDTFSIDVVVDTLKNGFGGVDDATFAGIDLVSSPLAIYANQANTAGNVTGTVSLGNGGTGATTAAGARSNLGLGNLSLINTSGVSTDVLKGDGTFSAPAAPTLAGDVSGSSSVNTVDKIKGRSISVAVPTNGQVLTWNNSTGFWEPQSPSASGVTSVAGRTGAVTINSIDIGDATSANTASKIVARDASGNFSAGTITATLSGTATNVSGTVDIANGGTGATSAAAARTNLSAAASGANTDITSITGAARQASMILAPALSGSGTTYALTNSPAVTSLVAGTTLTFRVNSTNTGAATLNVDGLGAVNILSSVTGAAVEAGDLAIGKTITVTYDGTNWNASIPQQSFTAATLNCGASIAANSSVVCPNIAATTVNAGDVVVCSPAADIVAGGKVTWSALATAGNISIRLGCNSTAACALTSRNWRCVVTK